MTSASAHPERWPRRKDHGAFALPIAVDFPYAVKVDDRRSMDTHELARVEFSAQIADRFAKHVAAISRMQAAIIVSGFDPVDLLRRQ